MSYLRSPVLSLANLATLSAMTVYFRSLHDHDCNLKEHETRVDELEGTLRGHIGLIEDSLERSEGQKINGQSERAQSVYTAPEGREEAR